MLVFAFVLRLCAAAFALVAGLHLVFGLGADVMLGAVLAPDTIAEPTLSSQNRFYGVAFALYGAVLFICATDLPRFEPMLKAALAVFFLAGVARLVPWISLGIPSPMVLVLMAIEVLVPPAIWLWYRALKKAAKSP